MYRILPEVLQPGFPATSSATGFGNFQPWLEKGLFIACTPAVVGLTKLWSGPDPKVCKKQGHFLGNGPENDVRKAIFPAEIQIAYNCRDRHFNYEGAAGECRFVSYGLVK